MPTSGVVTRWTPSEPAIRKQSAPDHWTKLKLRTSRTDLSAPVPASSGSGASPGRKLSLIRANQLDSSRFEGRREPQGQTVKLQQGVDCEATRSSLGNSFTKGQFVNYSATSSRPRSCLDNKFHEQAKRGYIYWYRERPKPTRYGSYHIGQYKTFLGLGSAPRS